MNDRIVHNPLVHHGQPVIKGTRIPVATIISGLTGGMSKDEIAQDYDIKSADVEMALSYAKATPPT